MEPQPAPRTRTAPPCRDRLIALILLGELVVFYHLPAALMALGDLSLKEFYDSLLDREYFTFASIFGVLLVSVQAAFLLPLHAPARQPDPRPGWLRLIAISLSLGVVAGAAGVYVCLSLSEAGLAESNQVVLLGALVSGPAVVSPLSLAWMRRRYRDAMPIFSSILMAALLAGVLLAALLLIVLGVGQLIGDFGLGGRPLESIVLAAPLVGWAVFTPIITAFVRRGDPHSRLARVASLLLIGTGVELVSAIPIEVLMRRKTSCYCDTASFWALSLTLSVGAVVLGPAVYLAPLRRSWLRQIEGRCRACGYDMSATPRADRCPECGVGWKSAGRP